MQARPPRLYILCGNAAFNKGDRGNLDTQIKLLRDAFPGADITLDSMRAEVDQRWYDAKVLPRGWLLNRRQIAAIARADAVIWGGGALVADNSFRLLIPMWLVIIGFVRFVLRKPILAWSHGVVLETRLGRCLASILFRWVDVITVRDDNSYAAVKALPGVTAPLLQTADPAIHLRPLPIEVGDSLLREIGVDLQRSRRLVAISPTYWQFYHRHADILPYMLKARFVRRRTDSPAVHGYNRALAELCRRLVAELDAQVLLLPRYACPPWHDVDLLRDVARDSGCGNRVTLFERDDVAPEVYTAMYRRFDLLVSTALHDAIFATALDVPCVKLYYEPKGRDFFAAIDAQDRSLDWRILYEPEGVETVMRIATRTLADWDRIGPRAAAAKRRLQAAVLENVRLLETLLERASPQSARPRTLHMQGGL